jgi:7-cyano-7-deazaguanine synthase
LCYINKMENKKTLVLLSGGQDSATCLAIALEENEYVEAIAFEYGQRHIVELKCAKKLAELAQIKLKIINTDFFKDITSSALIGENEKIKNGNLPNTFVPGRNHIFLSLAAVYAYEQKISKIYTGVCQTDFSGYPDCRETFIVSLEKTLSLAMDYSFELNTPLMHLTKAGTVKKMQKLGKLDWYSDTHTCYEGKRPACGKCPACKLRLKGFREAKVKDFLEYEKQ